MCNTDCNFGVQAPRRNPHRGAGSEMAPGRAWQATAWVVQVHALSRIRDPSGPAGTFSHAEQLIPPSSTDGSSLDRNTTPSLMSCLFPSPLHWGRRQGQSTFLAAEGKQYSKWQLLWFALKWLAGPFITAFYTLLRCLSFSCASLRLTIHDRNHDSTSHRLIASGPTVFA